MQFSQINPYIRIARYLKLDATSNFDEVVPLDARLFYCIGGYNKVKIKHVEYEMKPHSLLIINSGTPYHILSPDKTVEYIAINFDYTQNASAIRIPIIPVVTKKFKKDMLIDYNTFSDAEALSNFLYIEKIGNIQKKLDSIIRECTQKLLFYESKSGHLLADCITASIRIKEIGDTSQRDEFINQIISYIHNNYNENITNQSIGKTFNYHPNYVSSLIKRITGMPLHKYIIHVRLMNSINLLENSVLPVSEIATTCGFCDTAYFSGYFKKYFGTSPSNYRKNAYL